MWILIIALSIIAIGAVIFFMSNNHPKPEFKDKHVLITGGSSGIGENMAYIFSHLGARLTLASNQPEDVHLYLPLVKKSKGAL